MHNRIYINPFNPSLFCYFLKFFILFQGYYRHLLIFDVLEIYSGIIIFYKICMYMFGILWDWMNIDGIFADFFFFWAGTAVDLGVGLAIGFCYWLILVPVLKFIRLWCIQSFLYNNLKMTRWKKGVSHLKNHRSNYHSLRSICRISED